MILILHGIFGRDYGVEHSINAASAEEAIEGLARQVGFYHDRLLDERPLVRVIGFDDVDALKRSIPNDTVLHLVPAMFGGGGNFGKILIGGALIALAASGVGAGLSVGLGALGTFTAGGVLATVGIGIALQGVMGVFMKAPSLSKDTDPAASKYLGSGEVTTELGTLISYCIGTVKMSGQLLSSDVTSNTLSYGVFPANPT